MSNTRSVQPRAPSLKQALPLAARYQAGERLAALAREWGCWRNDLRRRLDTLGVLRPEDRLPRRCRVCRDPVRGTRHDLCARHVRCYCSRCERPLPQGRVNRWCLICEGERKPADYLRRRRQVLARPRGCVVCGMGMPPGRLERRCTSCQRQYQAGQRQRPGRRCAGCWEPIPPRNQVYCDPCSQVQSKWRRDYHQGKPEALALRPIEPRRYWQRED